jgi:hypothetical protein
MRRPAIIAVAAALALCGCGNDRTKPPDVKTAGQPLGSNDARFPTQGIRFLAPAGWSLDSGVAPLVATTQTGRATVAIWRYPRSEPLPRTKAQLTAARDALVAAATARDPTFKAVRTIIRRLRGVPAIVLLGTETIEGQPRTVRSTHVYAHGAETVVDAYAPAEDFERLDASVFRPLVGSLRVSALQGGR